MSPFKQAQIQNQFLSKVLA